MNIWDKAGKYICPICKKGKASIYNENINGVYTTGCWKCLYK